MSGAQWATWRIRDDTVLKVTGCWAMLRFEAKKEKFIFYSLSDWQPMQLFQKRSHMIKFLSSIYNPCCTILNSL